MIQVRAGRAGLFLTYPDGRVRRFGWWWLTPFVAAPALLLLALAFQSQPVVRYYTAKGLKEPAYAGSAAKMFAHVNRASLENLLFVQPEPLESELPTVRLVIGNNTISDMMRALAHGDPALDHDPGGNRPYFPALLVNGAEQSITGQLCLRGSGQWHHKPEKPSLRFRIRQEDVRDRRFLELSRPEDVLALKNWLPDRMGRRLGLLSDRSEHVRLVLNQKSFGVYLASMRPEEPLALLNGRLPGTFFKGDVFDRQLRPRMWVSPRDPVWGVDGELEDPLTLSLFDRFLAACEEPASLETLLELERVLDTEVHARWSALQIATTSVHTDQWHNHMYFATPYQGRIEAVPWDMNGFGVHVTPRVPPELLINPPMLLISRDPRWVHRRNEVLSGLVNGDLRPERISAEIDAAVARMRKDLEADENLSSFEWTAVGLIEVPWSVRSIDEKVAELKRFAAERHSLLRAWLDDARVSVEPDPAGGSRVTVWGHVAVRVALDGGGPVESDGWPGAPDLLYPGLSEELLEHREASFEGGLPYAYATPAPLVYRVGAPPERLRFANAITGAAVTPIPAGPFSGRVRSFHPSTLPAPPVEDVVLGPGEVRLERDLETAPGQRLVLLPGTRLRLAAGVGIHCQGEVVAEGTAEAPIEIAPIGSEAWGAFGVRGPGADRSRFRHLRVAGGSSGTGLARWRGMFNLYGAPGLDGQGEAVIADCTFEASRGDDAVNLAEVVVAIERTTFADTQGDALDLDGSRATLNGCRFERVGDDALETSYYGQTVVRDTTFAEVQGSALLAGQGARLVARGCRVRGADRALELIDGARALLVECALSRAGTGVFAEMRQPHHGGTGGIGALLRCRLGSNKVDVQLESQTHLYVLDTTLVGMVDAPPDRFHEAVALSKDWDELLRLAGEPRE